MQILKLASFESLLFLIPNIIPKLMVLPWDAQYLLTFPYASSKNNGSPLNFQPQLNIFQRTTKKV